MGKQVGKEDGLIVFSVNRGLFLPLDVPYFEQKPYHFFVCFFWFLVFLSLDDSIVYRFPSKKSLYSHMQRISLINSTLIKCLCLLLFYNHCS